LFGIHGEDAVPFSPCATYLTGYPIISGLKDSVKFSPEYGEAAPYMYIHDISTSVVLACENVSAL
jgi:hypothetical protein